MSSYFGTSGSGSPVVGAGTSAVSNPTLFSDSITVVNTEQSYVIPAGTKWFSIINQTVPVLKVAYTIGQSGTNYRLIPKGCSTVHPNLDSSATIVIYYQSSTLGGRVEIESWS